MRREEALNNLYTTLASINEAIEKISANEYSDYLKSHLIPVKQEIQRQIQCIKGRL